MKGITPDPLPSSCTGSLTPTPTLNSDRLFYLNIYFTVHLSFNHICGHLDTLGGPPFPPSVPQGRFPQGKRSLPHRLSFERPPRPVSTVLPGDRSLSTRSRPSPSLFHTLWHLKGSPKWVTEVSSVVGKNNIREEAMTLIPWNKKREKITENVKTKIKISHVSFTLISPVFSYLVL